MAGKERGEPAQSTELQPASALCGAENRPRPRIRGVARMWMLTGELAPSFPCLIPQSSNAEPRSQTSSVLPVEAARTCPSTCGLSFPGCVTMFEACGIPPHLAQKASGA